MTGNSVAGGVRDAKQGSRSVFYGRTEKDTKKLNQRKEYLSRYSNPEFLSTNKKCLFEDIVLSYKNAQ